MNLACLEARFDELITNSKSRQKDSDGFMLGARTEQVNEIDSVAHEDTRELFNTHEEIVSADNLCRETSLKYESCRSGLELMTTRCFPQSTCGTRKMLLA